MPLREFTDSSDTRWKVWDVIPQQVHPVTRAEDYLEGFLEGWLVFESIPAGEKRRLHPLPVGWEAGDASALEKLCRAATAVDDSPHAASGSEAASRRAGTPIRREQQPPGERRPAP